MERLFRHINEIVLEFTGECKALFYDSYSGLKIKRIAIVAGTSATTVALIALFVVIVPQGALTSNIADGVVTVMDAVLPVEVATSLKTGLAKLPQSMFHYSKPDETATTPSDTGNSGIVVNNVEASGDDWVWKGSWGPPSLGDIQATSGTEVTKDKKGSKAEEETITYYSGTAKTPTELRSTALLAVQRIQDNILLQINNATANGDWYSFSISARSTLIDVPALGAQIKPHMSDNTVAIWNSLEPVYTKLYADIYACESNVDLTKVASDVNYTKAVELTSAFISAITVDRVTTK